MKNFLSSNHWWITSTIIFISAIIQLLIYKTAFSAAYPQSLFLTLLIYIHSRSADCQKENRVCIMLFFGGDIIGSCFSE